MTPELKCSGRQDQDLHLHPTNIPPQTHPGPSAEREEKPLHITIPTTLLASVFLSLTRSLLHPPLRPERINIFTEDLLIAVHYPRISTHSSAGRNEAASNSGAGARRDAREGHADRRVQAEGFVHDCLEVGEAVCFCEGDGGGETAFIAGCVEFDEEFCFACGIFEQEVDDGARGDGSRVGAGEDVGCGH